VEITKISVGIPDFRAENRRPDLLNTKPGY
jgi:hypothetical protein